MKEACQLGNNNFPSWAAIVFATRTHPILGGSSVSIEHRDYVVGLAALNAQVRILDTSPPSSQERSSEANPKDERIIRDLPTATNSDISEVVCIANAYDFFTIPGKDLKLQTQRLLSNLFPHLKRVFWVARAITETTHVPKLFAEGLTVYDEIWVPSDFHFRTFATCGIAAEKVRIIPEALNVDEWVQDRDGSSITIANRRKFAFLAVSRYPVDRLGQSPSWNQARKAIPLLLRAFTEEFDPDEDVCLLLKGSGSIEEEHQRIAEWLKEYDRRDSAPQVIPFGGPISNRKLLALMSQADAFVGVGRGEGWGRPMAEAMLLGKPTIGTRFGGNTEFMNENNSYLVECSLVPVAAIFPKLTDYGYWAEPSLSSFRKILRNVFANSLENTRLTRRCAEEMSALYNRKVVAELILRRVREILAQVSWR